MSDFSDALEDLAAEPAWIEAIYSSAAGGEPVETRVFLVPAVDTYPSQDRRIATGPKNDIAVKLVDIPDAQRDDEIETDAGLYRVDGVVSKDQHMARLRVKGPFPGS